MGEASYALGGLISRFEFIWRERMRGLPFVNPRLGVEAVDFRRVEEHELGVLIAPWFMNLVLLPGTDEWAELAQGVKIERMLPSGSFEFTLCRDEEIGVYLTGVLFRTVSDFPDQETARAVASEVLVRLFTSPDEGASDAKPKVVSRRALLAGFGAT